MSADRPTGDEPAVILEIVRQVTQTTLRAESPGELLEQVCRDLVESERYRFAWVGVLEEETDRVRARASAGPAQQYLAGLEVTVGEGPTAAGPTGRAFTDRSIQVAQDIAEDDAFGPWRDAALEQGFRSSAAVPLAYEDGFFGVLNVYSSDPGAFDAYERDLLVQLGQDIAFGISAIETRASLARNRDFLERTERLAGAGGWEYDPAADAVRLTPGARRIFDVAPDERPTRHEAVAAFHPEDRPTLEGAVDSALEAGEAFDHTLRLAADDDRQIQLIGRPTDQDHPRVIRGALRDVTEERQREAQLAVRNEQLLLINRIVRHDIRNDMSIILGWGGELADHVDDVGESMLERILDGGQHVLDLTYDLRDFVESLETDEREPLAAIPLHEVLSEELEKRRSAYPQAEFTFETELPDVWVRADELLSSVFRNILDNAVIHNDADSPRVRIAVEERDGTAVVRIADNGPGIPTDRRDAVLGRAPEGLDHPAAGLGLYLVDTLVTGYAGTVTIDDNDPSGAVFTVELDVAPAPKPGQETASERPR